MHSHLNYHTACETVRKYLGISASHTGISFPILCFHSECKLYFTNI